MLRNPFYVGEVRYKGEILPGPQPPLLDRALFDAVQAKLTAQRSHRTTTRLKSPALLTGLLFDDAGQRMVSTHATKNRIRYRYYVSASCLRGSSDEAAGSVTRIPAKDIELAVVQALITDAKSKLATTDPPDVIREMLERLVTRVEVQRTQLTIYLKDAGGLARESSGIDPVEDAEQICRTAKALVVPWKKASTAREIIRPSADPAQREKPIKAGPRVALVRSIALGRFWLQKIMDQGSTVAAIAADHGCGVRMVNMTISLAFLSPSIVTAAVQGKLPRGLSVRTLRDPPPEWSRQLTRLGLAPAAD